MILYKIEILGWEKYNKKSRANMPSVMISKRFFDDAKMQTLPPSGKLLYLFLLLRRGDVDTTTFEASHDDCVTSAGGRGVLVVTLLDQLMELQLLRYEKVHLNRKEVKVKEVKVKELKVLGGQKNLIEKMDSEQNKLIKQAYIDAYRLRYGIEPATKNAKFNTTVSNLRKQFGVDEAIGIVKFYLTHNDSFYVRNTHAIGICLSQGDTLRTQMLRGKAITGTMIRDFEKKVQRVERDQELENMWKDEPDVK